MHLIFLSTKIGSCKNSEHTGSLHSKKLRVTTVLAKLPLNALLAVFLTPASPGPAWQGAGLTRGRGAGLTRGRGAVLPPPGVGLLWKVIASVKREQARLDNEGHDVLRKLSPANTPASGPEVPPPARGLEGRPGVLLTPGKQVSTGDPGGAAGVQDPCSRAPRPHASLPPHRLHRCGQSRTQGPQGEGRFPSRTPGSSKHPDTALDGLGPLIARGELGA